MTGERRVSDFYRLRREEGATYVAVPQVLSAACENRSKIRRGRFRQSDFLRHMFETVVERCLAQGLIGAEGFAVDISLIAADADKQRSVSGAEWEAKEDDGGSVQEYWPFSVKRLSVLPRQ